MEGGSLVPANLTGFIRRRIQFNRSVPVGFLKLLDHLVRPNQYLLWNRDTNLLRGLEIDHHLELRRLHALVGLCLAHRCPLRRSIQPWSSRRRTYHDEAHTPHALSQVCAAPLCTCEPCRQPLWPQALRFLGLTSPTGTVAHRPAAIATHNARPGGTCGRVYRTTLGSLTGGDTRGGHGHHALCATAPTLRPGPCWHRRSVRAPTAVV